MSKVLFSSRRGRDLFPLRDGVFVSRPGNANDVSILWQRKLWTRPVGSEVIISVVALCAKIVEVSSPERFG
jgi:hypothetical protein